ncbi:MAG: T9SS type A sorting domain-containing protein [bacterium]
MVRSGARLDPACRVTNLGTIAATCPVTLSWLDSAGTPVWQDTRQVTIAPGDSTTVRFPEGTYVTGLWNHATLVVLTRLADDENPGNDTCRMALLASTDTLRSYRVSSVPGFDGLLTAGEWDSAYAARDLSNLNGWRCGPRPVGSARAWFCHDASYLYFAAELPRSAGRAPGDMVGLFFDANNDGTWSTDRSEGGYFLRVSADGSDEAVYCWCRADTWDPAGLPIPGDTVAISSLGGTTVIEGRIPFGDLPYQLAARPTGDTLGLWLVMADDSLPCGWWPGNLADSLWREPAFYGKLVLLPTGAGITAEPNSPAPGIVLAPNPCRGRTSLTWNLPGTRAVTVELIDASGRIRYRTETPGRAGGLALAPPARGVFLLRVRAGEATHTRKLVVE